MAPGFATDPAVVLCGPNIAWNDPTGPQHLPRVHLGTQSKRVRVDTQNAAAITLLM